jgi:hypothetical protein
MKPCRCLIPLLAVSGVLLGGGCASRDVNSQAPRPGRGYVDFFTQPREDLWWKVDVFDSRKQDFREFTAQFKAPGEGILRVEARPGPHKGRISFVNRAVEAPVEVSVEVREGMITPVEVTLRKGGTSFTRSVEDRARSGFQTANRNQVNDYSQQLWQISAKALPPIPYTPKQNAAYWK